MLQLSRLKSQLGDISFFFFLFFYQKKQAFSRDTIGKKGRERL